MTDNSDMPERVCEDAPRKLFATGWWRGPVHHRITAIASTGEQKDFDKTLYVRADLLTTSQARVAELEAALAEINRLGRLVAHDLVGRVEGGKVSAVLRTADIARAALRTEGET
jgi:hypothetical protein